VTFPAAAQIQQAWVERYNNGITNGTNQAVKMALDNVGNIYVVGVSQNTNNQLGYVTIKYAPNGTQLWAARYDSTNYPSAMPAGMVLDNSNNVIVTGSALTIKYDTNGNRVWNAPYAGSALAVDTNGNVAVTGFGPNFNSVKINPSGSNLWEQQISPASCGSTVGQAIVSDSNGNIYVVGSYPFTCERGLVDNEMLLIKYSANGSQLWSATYSSGGPDAPVHVAGMDIDNSNNLYVLATFPAVATYATFKYSSGGSFVWSVTPNYNGNSEASGLALDHLGNVLVTGMAKYFSFYFQYGTFAINSNGSPVWTNYYPQPPAGVNAATSVAVDSANNSYVTGYSSGTNGTNNIVTIKYSPSGNQIWLQQYNGLNSGTDAGNAIAVDKNGNVYVTGYETLPGGGTGIVTIKYIPVSLQRHADGTVLLEVQGSPGESFDIQASADLLNWTDLGNVLADTNGLMQFDDTNASNFSARFYVPKPQ